MPDTFYKPEFPNGHFYSPYPPIAEVGKNAVDPALEIPRTLTGIETQQPRQRELRSGDSLLANSSDYRIILHPCFLMGFDRPRFASNGWQFETCGGSIYLEKNSHGG